MVPSHAGDLRSATDQSKPSAGRLQIQPSAFRLGTEDEATLASTSAFSTALIRWYLWRREASGWPFFSDDTPPGTIPHQLPQLYVLLPERLYLLLRGVPHRVPG